MRASSSSSSSLELTPDHTQMKKNRCLEQLEKDLHDANVTLHSAFEPVHILPLVDREAEILLTIKALAKNQFSVALQLPRDKRYVCFLDQMFGSGKTTFSRSFLPRARLAYVLYLKVSASEDFVPHKSWTEDLYAERVVNDVTRPSLVNLGRLLFEFREQWLAEPAIYDTAPSPDVIRQIKNQIFETLLFDTVISYCDSFSSFCHVIKDSVHLTFSNLISGIEDSRKLEFLPRFNDLRQDEIPFVLQEFMTHIQCKSILFIMDETTEVSTETVRSVWQRLHDISINLYHKSARLLFNFMFVGRSTMFLSIGRGTHRSPTLPEWICLSMLQKVHVKELLQTLLVPRSDDESVAKSMMSLPFLGQPEIPEHKALFDHFVHKMHEATGGHPRMLQYTINAIIHIAPIIKNTVTDIDAIDVLFDDLLFKGIDQRMPDKEKYLLEGKSSAERSFLDTALAALLFSGEISTPLNVTTYIHLPHGDKMQIGELLDRLPLFITKTGNNTVKVRRSQYLYRLLSKSNRSGKFSYGTYLSGLLSQFRDESAHFTSVDTLFEFLFSAMTHHRAEFSRRTGQPFIIPGVLDEAIQRSTSATHVSSNLVQAFPISARVLTSNTDIKTMVIPQILNKVSQSTGTPGSSGSSATPSFSNTAIQIGQFSREKTATLDELASFFTVLSETDGLWILIPRDQSHSGDRYVCFRQRDLGLSLLIGWQIKSGDGAKGWASIAVEQAKFLKSVPQHEDAASDHQNSGPILKQIPVFVMASRNHTQEVREAIGERDTLYIPGGYDCWQQGSRLLMVDIHKLQQRDRRRQRHQQQQTECGFVLVGGSLQNETLKTNAHTRQSRNRKTLELRRGNDENSPTLPKILYDGNAPDPFFEGKKWKHVLSVPQGSHVVIWSTRALESFLGSSVTEQFSKLKDISSLKVETMCKALNDMSQSVELTCAIGPPAELGPRGQKRLRDEEALSSESRRRVGTSHEPSRENEEAVPMNPNVQEVKLKVGRDEFSTTLATLTNDKSAFFTQLMKSGRYQEMLNREGQIFIDRTEKHFDLILEFLRNSESPILSRIQEQLNKFDLKDLLAEVTFYGIQPLIEAVNERITQLQQQEESEHSR